MAFTERGEVGTKRAGDAVGRAIALGLLTMRGGLACWGLRVAAGVAALAPRTGLAGAFALAAGLHGLVACAAVFRLRVLVRRAAARRRARIASFALLRSAMMLLPGRRRPGSRQGVAAVLAALTLLLVPGRGTTPGPATGAGTDRKGPAGRHRIRSGARATVGAALGPSAPLGAAL